MAALVTWWTLDIAELAPGARPDAARAIGADLLRRLEEPHRRYHTTRHLVEVFWALEDLEQAGEITAAQGAITRLAGWFHDAVYDPRATGGENELLSAELASRDLAGLGVRPGDVAAVRALVLATQSHALTRGGPAAAFHDADLWILSAPPDRYAEYTAQVREEYAAVPDEAFRAGRAAILRPFLERTSIYATGTARERWEERARANVTDELDVLTAR
ncbi:metal-dependent phosphohydrolase [Nostocoides sp. HKS02]|uniref:HD domain-containing protein n=1 Tax=Nostocoides sp. HKS02 TaxID=1813880 RepID=UPI0012B4B806|nr:metal-dependent phosphohydrolase [Tetrasphaera sp. HKS02]QGN59003.1 metal-dependent phosphohydrolase [Tetrasphaera sp. HKS02]